MGESRSASGEAEAPTAEVRSDGSEPDGFADAGELPQRVDRYRIVSELGRGGMGKVFLAEDPDLGRRVALKMLHADAVGSQATPGSNARIIREARAMARLSHPNVVPVYDVGAVDGEIYVTMEYVEGQTLRRWIDRAKPDLRTLLSAFVEAGRGLAAAHAAGLVHRDFKPGNVLVGNDGRIRVLDFGLARGSGSSAADSARPDVSARAELELTEAGKVVGTPAYMAPEQHRGAEATARSDQYAFCIALYDAVFGVKPFSAASVRQLAAAKQRGEFSMPRSSVPRILADAIARGLQPDPGQRWPDMHALLAVLNGFTSRRGRRPAFLLAAGGLLVVCMTALAWPAGDAGKTCDGAAGHLGAVWDATTAAELKSAFAAADLPYAVDVGDRLTRKFDGYTERWIEEHRDACEATRVRREQSDEVLELRMACLNRARSQLQATVDALRRDVDDHAVREALQVADRLVDPAACGDVERLHRSQAPTDPRASGVQERILAAWALVEVGRAQSGLDALDRLTGEVEVLGHAPALAELQLRRGRALSQLARYGESATALEASYLAAQRSGAFEIAADAAIALVLVHGADRHDEAAAQQWSQHAAALVERLADPGFEAAYRHNLASFRYAQGDYRGATELNEKALAVYEEHYPPNHTAIASGLHELAIDYLALGQYDRVTEVGTRARAIWEETLGPSHPHLASTLDVLAGAEYKRGNLDGAAAWTEQALSIKRQAYGPDHPAVATGIYNLGLLAAARGEYPVALDLHRQALEIREERLGDRDPGVALSLMALADVQATLGKRDEARTSYERAIRIIGEAHGPDHPDLVVPLRQLGGVLLAAGEDDEALAVSERALDIAEHELGPEHPGFAAAARGLAEVERELGRLDDARVHADRALTVRRTVHGPGDHRVAIAMMTLAEVMIAAKDPAAAETIRTVIDMCEERPELLVDTAARARFGLARVLAANADPARAVTLAREALAGLREDAPEHADLRREVTDWLRDRRG